MVIMPQVNRFPGRVIWRTVASGFGVGYIPAFPGTLGSLLALPLWYWGGGKSVVPLFLLFRLFDIVKLGPAEWLDSRDGAIYVVADDLMAAIYANLAYRGLMWVIGGPGISPPRPAERSSPP